MEAIDGLRFCPEMRQIAERSVLDGELAGVADETQATAIRAHLEHCGPCRGFLASLRSDLHELGGAALLGGLGAGKLGLLGRLLGPLQGAGHALQSGAHRVRLAAYRSSGALAPEGGGSAGLLAGTGQKIAAACTAGAAGAATCVATGIVGPGLGVASHHVAHHHPPPPPAHVREASPSGQVILHPVVPYAAPEEAPQVTAEAPAVSPTTPTAPKPRGGGSEARSQKKPEPAHREAGPPATTSEQTEESEFGIEEESTAAVPAESVAPEATTPPVAASRTVESTAPPASSGSGSSSNSSKSGGGSGQEEFGFGG
jgi:hypothetical protein